MLKGLRRKVVKADLCQGYALLLLVVLRDELAEEPDAERGGALWHGGGILGGPRHPRDVEVCPGDIIDKALKKLRAQNASGGATTAYIFHVGRVAVDLAVVLSSSGSRQTSSPTTLRRFAVPLLVSSIVLFYVGIAFAYYFVFPVMFQFFAGTTPRGVSMMTDINNYLDFVLTMFFCFGLAFEVPVAVVLLVLMGIVRIEKLKEHRGYVLIGIFILAALLTPPDAISQCSLAIPMYLLYEGGILMARILSRHRSAQAPAKTSDT